MELPVDADLIKQKISEMVRHSALTRIEDHSRLEGFRVSELSDKFEPGQVLGNWMSIILVTGEALRITLKFHFSQKDAKGLSHTVYGVENPDDVQEAKATDFIKEFSNLTAGLIVQTLESLDIPMGISLPLCTRGFYEVFADYKETSDPLIRYGDIWRLERNQYQISSTVMVEISDIEALSAIANFDPDSEVEEDEDDDFDFL
jgi:CheY-specific phosphatase CheX